MMGRVCPAPCEDGCNRNDVEDFVGINAVEQFIGDNAFDRKYTFETPELGEKRVAIIGGGPAGLAAAYQLRRKGHGSTIFEEHDQLGGMMRYGIPGYRTPRDYLDHEIQRILDMGGIEVRAGVRVGSDVTVGELDEGFDAVIWCIGCQTGRPLPVPGSDAPNCVSGVQVPGGLQPGQAAGRNRPGGLRGRRRYLHRRGFGGPPARQDPEHQQVPPARGRHRRLRGP